MDIPNVNWCVFDKINAERETKRDRDRNIIMLHFFYVGSCGLHSIHGDFETAMTSNQ